ncbi:MAG: hypothetical protein JW810_04220 [Sedimentisphaerales bacterium]|nr:hypothetical protein [Sedimentisphaerales bacterium]
MHTSKSSAWIAAVLILLAASAEALGQPADESVRPWSPREGLSRPAAEPARQVAGNPAAPADAGPAGDTASPPAPAPFDRQRYIDIDEIRPGMRGYGLTVFQGAQPERFEVEAVSVVHNFLPKINILLVRCLDDRHKFSNPVGGDSGSPVFFDGRLAGALAYGWSFTKEPLYGMTPIRYMLQVKGKPAGPGGQASPAARTGLLEREVYRDLLRDELLSRQQRVRLFRATGLMDRFSRPAANGWCSLPLALSVGGFSPQAIEKLAQWMPGYHLEMAGGGAGDAAGHEAAEAAGPIDLQPGSVLTIPVVSGDMSMRVIGTVTEVVGDRVYGFGHPFNAEGETTWPLAGGVVHTVVNKTDRSFKLGESTRIIGAIYADETPAVFGRIGSEAPLLPIELQVHWDREPSPDIFHLQMAQHDILNPTLVASSIVNALTQRQELPPENTLEYQVDLAFDGAGSLRFDDVISGEYGWSDMVNEVFSVTALMLENPWQKVKLAGVRVQVRIGTNDTLAPIKSIQLNRALYQPGDTIQARLVCERLRLPEETITMQMKLPEDLPAGKYKLAVGSELLHRRQLQSAHPQRYMAFRGDDIQRILQERLTISRRKVYMSLIVPRMGVALADERFVEIPTSKAMLLTDPSRNLETSLIRPIVEASVETSRVITGGKLLDIEIRRD